MGVFRSQSPRAVFVLHNLIIAQTCDFIYGRIRPFKSARIRAALTFATLPSAKKQNKFKNYTYKRINVFSILFRNL